MTEEVKYLESDLFGTNPNSSNFEEISESDIIGFNFKYGTYLNSIQPIYEGNTKGKNQGGGGTKKMFKLGKGETFSRINVRSGSYIHALQFETKLNGKQKTSEWFGGIGGSISSFDVKGRFVGIRGSSGTFLQTLQFLCLEDTTENKNGLILGEDLKKALNYKSFSD
eukprot:gene4461-7836_t